VEKGEAGKDPTLMRKATPHPRPKFYSGFSAIPIRLKFRLAMGKYLLNRNKYPLFLLSPSQGGLIKTQQTLRDLKFCKVVKFGRHHYFSLTVPRWPSKPFDSMVANGGLNITAAGTPKKSHIDTAILGISRKCTYKCQHCYEYFNLSNEEYVPVNRWKHVISELQELGTSHIIFSGGEPMLRYDEMLGLLNSADKDLSEFHVHTSGHEVTSERAMALWKSGLCGAGIGLDDADSTRHDALRGYEGAFQEAVQAVSHFNQAGIFTYLNTCLTKDMARSGGIQRYFELSRNLGVGIVRWLEPKPCGGYYAEHVNDLFTEDDRKLTTELYLEANHGKKYRDYPLIVYEAYSEAPERLGCMMGGLSLLYINSLGHVQPCVFLPISFGSIMEENFSSIYRRMREAIPRPLHTGCPSNLLSEKIKEKGTDLPVPYNEIEDEWLRMFN